MSDWQTTLQQQLALADAPPVLTRDLLKRYSQSLNDGKPIAESSLTYWKTSMVRKENLRIVQRGLFLNKFRAKNGTLADACFWSYPDAVVSLNTVLGDSGVLNNPSIVVTAVVPFDQGEHPPARLGRKITPAGTLHFFGLPRQILQAGKTEDRLDSSGLYEHLRATPEKALLDWIYLGASPRSRRQLPTNSDIDIQMLDRRRLMRLAKAAGMADELRAWLGR